MLEGVKLLGLEGNSLLMIVMIDGNVAGRDELLYKALKCTIPQ
jgi:hypothetical protein